MVAISLKLAPVATCCVHGDFSRRLRKQKLVCTPSVAVDHGSASARIVYQDREPTSIAIVEVGVQASSFQMESEEGHMADGLRMTHDLTHNVQGRGHEGDGRPASAVMSASVSVCPLA